MPHWLRKIQLRLRKEIQVNLFWVNLKCTRSQIRVINNIKGSLKDRKVYIVTTNRRQLATLVSNYIYVLKIAFKEYKIKNENCQNLNENQKWKLNNDKIWSYSLFFRMHKSVKNPNNLNFSALKIKMTFYYK